MAKTWEWNPEADAMDSGFKLDELLRRERGDTKRTQMNIDATRANMDVAHQNRLGEMLYGDQLKQQAADREAERAAPFLQAMISGNPQVGKVLGFGTPAQPGALTQQPAPDEDMESRAFLPRTQATPAGVRTPTLKEVSGIAKAIPGITTELVKRNLDPNAQFTLGPGQERFDAQGNKIASGQPKPGAYQSYNEAMLAAMQQQTLNQASGLPAMRPTIDQDSTGAYQIKWSPADPLNPVDPIRQKYEERVKAGDPQAYEKYLADQGNLAGIKTRQQQLNMPPSADFINTQTKMQKATQSFANLEGFTDAERKAFVGLGQRTWQEAAALLGSLPEGAGVIRDLGGPEKMRARYQEWKTAHGAIRELAFVTGGKQLTKLEEDTVLASLPTGKETSYLEYKAKWDIARRVMKAQNAVMTWMQAQPREAVTDASIGQVWRSAFAQEGLDASDKEAWKKALTPDERLRLKVGNK